jgi:hypothetical protein
MDGKPPPTSRRSSTTPALTINLPTSPSACTKASGVAVCEPTWKVTPKILAAWRALLSKRTALAPATPYLRSSGILLFLAETEIRTHKVRSRQPPVSSAIFFSSSSLSSAKLRTLNSAKARRIAVRDLTGCIKCKFASGMVLASSISVSEATSKWRTPAP